jgi:hypothetical protein
MLKPFARTGLGCVLANCCQVKIFLFNLNCIVRSKSHQQITIRSRNSPYQFLFHICVHSLEYSQTNYLVHRAH